MLVSFSIDGRGYDVEYDRGALVHMLSELGLEPESSLEITADAVVMLYAVHGIGPVYRALAEKYGVTTVTVANRIKRGLRNAEFNGNLKNIDDLFACQMFDYDYGFTNKEFLASIGLYMTNNGMIEIKK